jgi:hypothetical protein
MGNDRKYTSLSFGSIRLFRGHIRGDSAFQTRAEKTRVARDAVYFMVPDYREADNANNA